MLPLFSRRDGPYAFYQDVDLVGSSDAVRTGNVDALPLIAASLRGSSRDDIVDHVVDAFEGATLRLVARADIGRLRLLEEESVLVDLLRAEPATVAALTQAMPLDRQRVRRLIYLLALTKSIEEWERPVVEQAPVSRAPRPMGSRASMPVFEPALPHVSSLPPRRRTPSRESVETMVVDPVPEELSEQHAAQWAEIDRYSEEIESQNYFEMLGVSTKATPDQVQSAYYAAVKKWHPDRLPAEIAEQRSKVDAIFRHLTRAQQVLSEPAERARYQESVKQGGGTPESDKAVGQIVHAAMEFRKAEVMMRRRQWGEAIELIDRILEVSPNETAYHAARGWALFNDKNGAVSYHEEVLESLDRAIELSDVNDKAYYYKGMVYRRASKDKKALAAFRRAADLNPRNIEAAREVRIANMRGDEGGKRSRKRKKTGRKSEPDASFLDKLFGSGKKR